MLADQFVTEDGSDRNEWLLPRERFDQEPLPGEIRTVLEELVPASGGREPSVEAINLLNEHTGSIRPPLAALLRELTGATVCYRDLEFLLEVARICRQ